MQISKNEVEEWMALFQAQNTAKKTLRTRPLLEGQPKPLPNLPSNAANKPQVKATPKPDIKPLSKPMGKRRTDGGTQRDR